MVSAVTGFAAIRPSTTKSSYKIIDREKLDIKNEFAKKNEMKKLNGIHLMEKFF
jgi:hypothetical protein